MISSILNQGLIDKSRAIELYQSNFEIFYQYVTRLYIGKLDRALQAYKHHHDLEELEILLSQAQYEILRNYTFDSDTFGPIMMYVFLKEKRT